MARKARPWYFTEKKCYAATVRGKRVILLKGEENAENFKKAEKQLRQIVKSKQADAPEKKRITVAEVIELYLKHNLAKYSEMAGKTCLHYLQQFADLHGWRKVNDNDCTPLHIEEWILANPKWKSDWTKMKIVRLVLRPFNWAVKKRIIAANPFRGVEVQEGKRRRPMTDEEFQQFLKASTSNANRKPVTRFPNGRKKCPSDYKRRARPSIGARFRQVLIFLKYTGARPGELTNLTWDCVDLEQKVIVLRQHKTSKKTGRPRVIPLHPVILKLLIFIKKLNQPGEYVFQTHRKRPWGRTSLTQRIARCREKAGISKDISMYGLRHRFGTVAILKNTDLKTLAELMGHTSTRITEHYLHLAGHREHLADAMLRINDPDQGT